MYVCDIHLYMDVYMYLFPQNTNISTWMRESHKTPKNTETDKAQVAHKT